MITPESIIVFVADYYKIPIDKVLSTCQKWDYVRPRQVATYFIKKYNPKMKLNEIGKYFPGKKGFKNHATLIFAIKSVIKDKDTDKIFKKSIDILDKKFAELSGVEIIFENVETEEQRFDRLWQEREVTLISENKYLKSEIINLKSEVSKLRGKIYALKLNKKKPVKKRTDQSVALIPDKNKIINLPIFKDPYSEIQPSNNKEYSGYREHSL